MDDEGTAVLMQKFYQKMVQQKLALAAALRAAQIEIMQEEKWKSPYYWAAFTLQGEWKWYSGHHWLWCDCGSRGNRSIAQNVEFSRRLAHYWQPTTTGITAICRSIGLSVLDHKKPDALPPVTLRQLPIVVTVTSGKKSISWFRVWNCYSFIRIENFWDCGTVTVTSLLLP